MSRKDTATLLSILEAADKILNYVKGLRSAAEYHDNSVVFDATLMNFVVIGEMVDRLSEELRAGNPDVDWNRIKSFRNIVAHDYMGVDADEVWQIIQERVPELRQQVKKILESAAGTESPDVET